MRSRSPFLLLAALVVAACDLTTGTPGCTREARWGLTVNVHDSLTGAPTASGAELVAHDAAFADTVSVPPNRPDLDAEPLQSATERPGVYTVTVRKAGFVDWVRSGVVVTAGECHVETVVLTARLQRAP